MAQKKNPKLGDILIEAGLVTALQVDTALQAQKIFGGRFGTNLIELGYLDDEALADGLSRQLGVPKVGPGEMEAIAPEVLAMIPAKAATRLCLLPVRVENGRLILAMLDPADERVAERIARNVGLPVEPRVVAEVELVYFLEKYYQVPRDIRQIKAMETLLARRREKAKAAAAPGAYDLGDWLNTIASAEEAVSLFLNLPGILGRIPLRSSKIDITAEPLPHQAAFLLFQVDGLIDIEDLLAISPFDRIVTARLIAEFIRRGYIELQLP